MKKAMIFMVLFCSALLCTKNLTAQTIDSVSLKTLSGWVNKYNLTPQLTKKITPLVVSQTLRVHAIDSLYPVSNSTSKNLKNGIRTAINDTIHSILIKAGYENIETNLFTKSLKYRKRLNLTNVEIDSLAAESLTLERLAHTFVPSTPFEESFDRRTFIDLHFRPLVSEKQYDTIVFLDLTTQGTGDAKKLWGTVQKNGLGNTSDSTSNFNAVVGYSTNRLLILKKTQYDTTGRANALALLNINKPSILKQLDDKIAYLGLKNQALGLSQKKWAEAVQDSIISGFNHDTAIAQMATYYTNELVIKKKDTVAAARDSALAKLCLAKPDLLKKLEQYNDDKTGKGAELNGLIGLAWQNRQILNLRKSLGDSLLAQARWERRQQNDANHYPDSVSFNKNTYENAYLPTVLTDSQFTQVLTIKFQPSAENKAKTIWKQLTSLGLEKGLNKDTTIGLLTAYYLQRFIIEAKYSNSTAVKKTLLYKLDAIMPSSLALLQYSQSNRLANKPVAGMYQW